MAGLDTPPVKLLGVADAPEGSAFSKSSVGSAAIPAIPKPEDPYKRREWQLEHMAAAFRFFARKGFTDGLSGHISYRDPVDPKTFWINPLGKHYAMLKASDMVQVNEEGQIVGGNKTPINVAGFLIHAAVHKARPDINAACHTHSAYGKAWSAFGQPLELLNQDSCVLFNNQSVYSSFGGVVLGADEGAHIAEALGPTNRCIILQNHGLLTAGGTVDEAAYLYSTMETCCKVQLLVESAGLEKRTISDDEVQFTAAVVCRPDILYWQFQPDFEYEVMKSKGELAGNTV